MPNTLNETRILKKKMNDKIFKRNITYGGPPKRIKERRPGANAKAT